MLHSADALAKLAARVRHLETLEAGVGADIPFVLGSAQYYAGLSAEIPVPRYAYHPDMLPAAPSAMDDEFNGAVLDAKWTWLNQGLATATLAESHLALVVPAVVGTSVRGIHQPAPATPWTATIQLRYQGFYQNYYQAGILLRESGTGKLQTFVLAYSGGFVILVQDYTDQTTFSSTWRNNVYPGADGYLRVTDDGVNLSFTWSLLGNGYWSNGVLVHARNRWFTVGPDQVGIGGESANISHEIQILSDWFRVT